MKGTYAATKHNNSMTSKTLKTSRYLETMASDVMAMAATPVHRKARILSIMTAHLGLSSCLRNQCNCRPTQPMEVNVTPQVINTVLNVKSQ